MDEMPEVPNRSNSFRHGIKKYAFEFLLLFLAVFLGFFADNIREQNAERQQARALAESFYEELLNDSIAAAAKVEGRLRKENAIDYMVAFFRDSSLQRSSKQLSINFLWATTVRTPVIFTPRTVALEQLKNTKSIQFFSKKQQQLIGDLSVAINYIRERQDLEARVYHEYIEPIMVKHMDFHFQQQLFSTGIFDRLAQYENGSEYIPFQLSQVDKVDRAAYINALRYYQTNNIKSTRLIPLKSYQEVNAMLLNELRTQFFQ